jgi:putative acyl-CoA dehydrogenase
MNAPQNLPKAKQFLADTHEVVNVSHELGDYNIYLQDAALHEGVRREGAGWAHDDLIAFGKPSGRRSVSQRRGR